MTFLLAVCQIGPMRQRRGPADVCRPANPTDAFVIGAMALPLPFRRVRRSAMLMFKRSQLYIGFALAALAEIIVRAVAR
jgi:hypothetical protein